MLPMNFDSASIFVRVCALAVIYFFTQAIYRIFFHPLSKYPGPILGKISQYYHWRGFFTQDLPQKQYELLKTYGSPVRVAPDELIFSDASSFGDIYGQSSKPCSRDPVHYRSLAIMGGNSVLNTLDHKEHARLRRILAHGFSQRSILESEPMIVAKIDSLVQTVFVPNCGGSPIDIHDKIHELFLDIVSQLSFGKSFNTLEGETDFNNHFLERALNTFPLTNFCPPIKYLPVRQIQEGLEALAKLRKFCQDAVTESVLKLEEYGPEDRLAEMTFLERLVTAEDPETGTKLSMPDLLENALTFLIGGSGTTAVTVVYTLWECGRRPEIMRKLVHEIRTAFPDPDIMPTYEQASGLSYFRAVVDESLRLHGPLSIALPRISPGRNIAGHFIPSGMKISTAPYATARNPAVFADASVYHPERWLNVTADMRNMSRPFSLGPGACIGRHLAEVDMTLTLVRLLQLFDITIDPIMTEEMMRPRDKGVIGIWDEKLVIRVRRAGEGNPEQV